MNNNRSIVSQCKSLSNSSSPMTAPCAETLRSLAPNEVFKCAIRRNRLLRTAMSGYFFTLVVAVVENVAAGGVRIGDDRRRESTLGLCVRGRDGGLSGDKGENGTGCWNHARSGFVLRTSLSICSRISLSWKNVLHLDVVAEFNGYKSISRASIAEVNTWSSTSFGSGSASNSFTKFCHQYSPQEYHTRPTGGRGDT
jgi:hypothetical protein